MILVDTSVWIDFFRGNPLDRVHALNRLLDENQVCLAAPVKIELLAGTTERTQSRLNRVLSALPLLYPTEETWRTAEAWISRGLTQGDRFGAMDLLIAAIAQEIKASLWSLDRDFHRMEKLGFVRLYHP